MPQLLEEGAHHGTKKFNQSLVGLLEAGNISLEDALAASDNREEWKMQMRGITRGVAAIG